MQTNTLQVHGTLLLFIKFDIAEYSRKMKITLYLRAFAISLLWEYGEGRRLPPCGGGSVGTGICEDVTNCCSQWGWCGKTGGHCDPETCWSGPGCPRSGTSNDTPCGGGKIGNGLCQDPSHCCSEWGWCAVYAAHCDTSTCYSNPDNSCTRPGAVKRQQPPTFPPSPPTTPSPSRALPTSCGVGFLGNKLCEDPSHCCSQWGWCGVSAEHCDINTCYSSPDNTCTRPDSVNRDWTPYLSASPSPTSTASKAPSPAPTNMRGSSSPTVLPTTSPTDFLLDRFKGITNAYSLRKSTLDLSWDNSLLSEDTVSYDVFVARGDYDFASALVKSTIVELIEFFQNNRPDLQHLEYFDTDSMRVQTPSTGKFIQFW